MSTEAPRRRIRLPVKTITSVEDCQEVADWVIHAVAKGTIPHGTADAMLRGVREWRQAQHLGVEVERRKALEKRLAELEAAKRP